ncbi:hypothetical protein [Micromonospora echinospora]|uniref:hypothetical protein n=1 Tax=Micromonospora echinospora TaxID=1877 RepID=UPI003A890FFC
MPTTTAPATHFVAYQAGGTAGWAAITMPAGIQSPADLEAIQSWLRRDRRNPGLVVTGWQRFETDAA